MRFQEIHVSGDNIIYEDLRSRKIDNFPASRITLFSIIGARRVRRSVVVAWPEDMRWAYRYPIG